MDPQPWEEVPYAGRLSDRSDAEPLFFTLEELSTAARKMPAGKVPGPDGLMNEVLRRVVQTDPETVLALLNTCLRWRRFPEAWKTAKLVLLHKGADRPIVEASNFRPICLINNIAKLMERLILVRLNRAVEEAGGILEYQFGFRRGRETVHAIARILETVKFATSGEKREGQLSPDHPGR